jgi:uncharacterized protein (DUF488 family)
VKKLPTKVKKIKLLTIGFTQKTAEEFFETLQKNRVKIIIDTRLNNVSQLAGFTKKKDLAYFLDKIAKIDYIHNLELAPTQDILTEYKKNKGEWDIYEQQFQKLIKKRQIETKLTPESIDNACLLCSEAKPHHCHRRLVAEYLQQKWKNVEIIHL